MKRSPSSAPEPALASRRRRGLSEEERALWESVARQIKPLRKKPTVGNISAAAPVEQSPVSTKLPSGSQPAGPPAKRPAPSRPPPLAPLGRRERSQLSRGRKEIDARLDLHGMTQTRAHRALQSFLQRASSDGLTFVLVITGKGTAGAASGRGVLRQQVPEWLSLPEFRPHVVGFEQAHKAHGGEGALYVRVRRVR